MWDNKQCITAAESAFRGGKNQPCHKCETIRCTMREEVRGKGENRGVHSCHGSMIITDSSVIEDLLTAFHYQQEMPNETGRGGRGGGESARRAVVVVVQVVIGVGGDYQGERGHWARKGSRGSGRGWL